MSVTNKALFVIERNLNRDLSLAEIAKACDVSRFHLAHAFGESTGLSVMEYLRGRRLTEAAYALASGAADILGVALDTGYQSHEAFSRAFKAQFGKTPEDVRKSESIDGLKRVDAIRHLETKAMTLEEPRIEKLPQQLFVGLPEFVAYGNMHTIAGQWQRFMSGPYEEIENKVPGIPVGIATESTDEGVHYVCAAEVSRFGKIPDGLAKVTLAPQTYLVFAHNDHITTLRKTYEAIWNEWLPSSGRTVVEAPSLDKHNPTFDPRTGNGGVTIWIPIRA
ncbi:MAG TPA: AraC family transcriptional regulator [Rhizomicrobium sp.]|nr:AraC family transcriptional regulator [Rhizomicrobium sp.]